MFIGDALRFHHFVLCPLHHFTRHKTSANFKDNGSEFLKHSSVNLRSFRLEKYCLISNEKFNFGNISTDELENKIQNTYKTLSLKVIKVEENWKRNSWPMPNQGES